MKKAGVKSLKEPQSAVVTLLRGLRADQLFEMQRREKIRHVKAPTEAQTNIQVRGEGEIQLPEYTYDLAVAE